MKVTDAIVQGLALELLGRGYLVRCYEVGPRYEYSSLMAFYAGRYVTVCLRGECVKLEAHEVRTLVNLDMLGHYTLWEWGYTHRVRTCRYLLHDPDFLDLWHADVARALGGVAAPAWGVALEYHP